MDTVPNKLPFSLRAAVTIYQAHKGITPSEAQHPLVLNLCTVQPQTATKEDTGIGNHVWNNNLDQDAQGF